MMRVWVAWVAVFLNVSLWSWIIGPVLPAFSVVPVVEAGTPDCATSLSEEEIENLRLRKEMDKARELYASVDALVSQSEVDYRGLAVKTDELMATVRSLQTVAGASERRKALDEMIRDIKALQVMATSRSASGYRNGLNALYENCFRCHLTHVASKPSSVPRKSF